MLKSIKYDTSGFEKHLVTIIYLLIIIVLYVLPYKALIIKLSIYISYYL